MPDPAEILYRAAKRAKSLMLNKEAHPPRCMVYADGSVHQFNHVFMRGEESEASAMMMKAACQLLRADYVVSIATIAMTTSPQQGQITLDDVTDTHEALLVVLNMSDGSVHIYLGKVLRDEKGVLCGFSEVRGPDVQMLGEQIPNPFLVPDGGLPEWLTDRVATLLGEGEAAALEDIRSKVPQSQQPSLH